MLINNIKIFIEFAIENIKMVPLCFILMTKRRIEDYSAVLSFVKKLLRVSSAEEFQVDFEWPIWKAIRIVYGEGISIHGCNYHWGQCNVRAVHKLK